MADIKRFYTVGAGSKEYEENYNKIKWNDDMEIKEFTPKEESDLARWFYPAATSLVESYGRKWKGRIPILVEMAWDHQQKRIDELEKKNKELKTILKAQSSHFEEDADREMGY